MTTHSCHTIPVVISGQYKMGPSFFINDRINILSIIYDHIILCEQVTASICSAPGNTIVIIGRVNVPAVDV